MLPPPEIGLYDAGIARNLIWCAFEQQRALRHYDDAVAQARDHVDVMLDQDEGYSRLVDLLDSGDQHLEQRGVHTRRRLIEQDHLGVGHHDARKFEQFALSARKYAGGLFCKAAERHKVQKAESLFARLPLLGCDTTRCCEVGPEPFTRLTLTRNQHVFDKRKFRKWARYLKGPRHATCEALVRWLAGNVSPHQTDST
jgi:hypothetical protein